MFFTALGIQRREERGGPVPRVVVRAPLDLPGAYGQHGLRAIERRIWDFSSAHNTSALSSGSRYSPTMSRTLSINSGSLDSLNVSLRCGCSPKRARSG